MSIKIRSRGRLLAGCLAMGAAGLMWNTGSASAADKTAPRDPGNPVAVISTSLGEIRCELFPKQAPLAVQNFIDLAKGAKEWTDPNTNAKTHKPLYDSVIFHRVIPKFMIQTGDPLGTGTGGPGYEFKDEFSPKLKFNVKGRLAMANSGPGTNGSQFFITTDPTPWLNNHHTIFGQVLDGLSVVKDISEVARDADDKPQTPVHINKITIEMPAARDGDTKDGDTKDGDNK